MLKTPPKDTADRQKHTIDMVTRLYVHTLQKDKVISEREIGILYSQLTNLFAHVDVSWEDYVRQIIDSEYYIDEVLDYLNSHLSQLDKVRILQSLIIMGETSGELNISDITDILDYCKKLSLNQDEFVQLVDHFESGSQNLVNVTCEHTVSHVRHSMFSDYQVFGSAPNADIRYRDQELAAYEAALYAIDKYLFLAVGSSAKALLDNKPAYPNRIYMLGPESVIKLGKTEFSHDCLRKVYDNRDSNDEIVFKKSSYDFIVNKRGSWYSLKVNSGSISLNDRLMLPSRHYERHYEIFYDDKLQIKGYAPWNLAILTENRSGIGLDDRIPRSLYINYEKDYFNLCRAETDTSIAYIEYTEGTFLLHPPKKGWTLFLNQTKVTEITPLILNSDTLTMNKRNFRINSFYDLIEIPFEIDLMRFVDLKHFFPDGQLALDSISFEARKGQLIGVLGQSGCGKSTLVKTLSGEIIPTYGQLQVDGKDFFTNLPYFLQYFGYVPQDDLLYPYLTVYENLRYRLRLRIPHLTSAILDQKINNILHQVNLSHQRDTKVGEFKKKNLSGGERKRLNIALELLFEPTVIICDEPTSGLSFTDAEQVVDILASLTKQGKIVLITIHQPNSSIFRRFDNVLLMDMGGRMAYYGSPEDCYNYFDEELSLLSHRAAEIEQKKHLHTSDFMYEVITYPEYNEFNEPVYEQIQGFVQPKRKFTPEYWRDKFKRKMLLDMIQHETLDTKLNPVVYKNQRFQQSLKGRTILLLTSLQRSLKMKLRNRTNNLITFVQAPLLGMVAAFILRYNPLEGKYQYARNTNIGIYIFVSIIAFIFLGLSNSIEEILDERKIILREKQMNLKISYYQVSKLFTLSIFALIQAILYQCLGTWILQIRGLFLISVFYLFTAAAVGFSLGLLCSAFIREKKAIINLLPLVLIPQIIFGGAVIEFERMNRNLTLYQNHPIPEIVQTIPSRWLFEGLSTAYAKNTAFHRAMNRLEANLEKEKRAYRSGRISAAAFHDYQNEVYNRKLSITERWDPDKLQNEYLNSAVSIMDGTVLSENKNVFLSSYKAAGKVKVRTWNYNLFILLMYLILFNAITHIKLKYYFNN